MNSQNQSFTDYVSKFQKLYEQVKTMPGFYALKPRNRRVSIDISASTNVRKSRRLQQKQKRRQIEPKKPKIIRIQPKKKSKEQEEQDRTMIQRLKKPSKITLSQANIMFKDNTLYYSIDIKEEQKCQKHMKSQQGQNKGFCKQLKQDCRYCKKVGRYWFSEYQLRKLTGGEYFRRFVESHLI